LPASSAFWSAETAAREGQEAQFSGGDEDAIAEFETLLTDAVHP